jgi:colanic acid biosynthesis glycosyl transferase WcaI
MHVLIVSLNYAPEPTGIGLYSGGLAQALNTRGHKVKVIAAKPHYPQWRVVDGHHAWTWETRDESGVSVTRCPAYIPANVSGLKRIIHYASFALSSCIPILSHVIGRRPDIVINVAPSLGTAPTILLSTKIAGTKSWLHIQDFEVEAAFATGHLSSSGGLANAARWFETKVMRHFDIVSSISPEMCKKLEEKDVSKGRIYEFRNWAELDHITPQAHSAYRAKWGLEGKTVALYSGNIASKQGIEMLIDVAKIMAADPDFHMVICGEGANRRALEQQAQGVANISFFDLQPMEQLPELLALASVHLLPQKADAADLVLPSKLTNMLASGKPVVAGAAQGTGLAREVEGCGIAVEPENAPAMAAAIKQLLDDTLLYSACATEARRRAELRWSKKAIIDAVEQRMEALVGKGVS